MSEERRDREQEGARRVLSPVRLAVLLLLGAFFLVLGGSRADAAEAEPVLEDGSGVLQGTLAAVDLEPVLGPVAGPVVAVTEPVLEPVAPVVAPVTEPLRPVVEDAVGPLPALPVAELVSPAPVPVAGSDHPGPPVHRTGAEGRADVTTVSTAAIDPPADTASAAQMAVTDASSEAPTSGAPVTRSASTTSDGGAGTPVPYAVLLTAFAAVLVLAGSVAPRRVAPPLAPTFLPPVFPG